MVVAVLTMMIMMLRMSRRNCLLICRSCRTNSFHQPSNCRTAQFMVVEMMIVVVVMMMMMMVVAVVVAMVVMADGIHVFLCADLAGPTFPQPQQLYKSSLTTDYLFVYPLFWGIGEVHKYYI